MTDQTTHEITDLDSLNDAIDALRTPIPDYADDEQIVADLVSRLSPELLYEIAEYEITRCLHYVEPASRRAKVAATTEEDPPDA